MTTDVAAVTTVDELFALPSDNMRHELVGGQHRVMSPTGHRHGRVVARVTRLLDAFVGDNDLGVVASGEPGFILARDPDTVRAPDAAFIAKERAAAVGDLVTYWPGAPDFAVEVVSPSDTFTAVEAKALQWIEAGTKLVLVIDPGRRSATTYRPGGQALVHREPDTLDLDSGVPGWRVAVAELFA